ncbi:sensor histidine kinase [Proteinivorax tanatarense]|uniref:histidine kinase n=1 Tax=Proteinivorax tanatarense TaxID=1260629 RepID=A0AAU7VPS0_9FIRM
MDITVYQLLKSMINNVAIIVMLAFILTKIPIFNRLLLKHRQVGLKGKLILALIFGLFGILATYNGFPVKGAIANARVIGVIAGGLVGGPIVGIGAGIIAGAHRYAIDIGGFTALACGLATVVEGFIGGYAHDKAAVKPVKASFAFKVGVVAELTQMAMILLIARPFADSLELVKIIIIPMTLMNSLGIALFVMVIQNIYGEREKTASKQAQMVLKIADQTLPFFRHGLNNYSAAEATKIIHKHTQAVAVAITDKDKIIGFEGAGRDHHKPGMPIRTRMAKEVIKTGTSKVAGRKMDIHCGHKSCRLNSAIMVPLKNRDRSIGSLVIFSDQSNGISSIEVELATGLAQLFSTQIELSNIEKQKQDLARAELNALQAQINPHFLFNALNTIVSYIRIKPDVARELLIHLGDFFRKNLDQAQQMVTLQTEIKHVKSYIAIEKARFGDKLDIRYDINQAQSYMVPSLILQPLVENSVKHGLLPKKAGGEIRVSSKIKDNNLFIKIWDNGVGMDTSMHQQRKTESGIGLVNVDDRLKNLYGEGYSLSIDSEKGKFTEISMLIPLQSSRRLKHG